MEHEIRIFTSEDEARKHAKCLANLRAEPSAPRPDAPRYMARPAILRPAAGLQRLSSSTRTWAVAGSCDPGACLDRASPTEHADVPETDITGTPGGRMKRVLGYIRVSTGSQAEDGVSLDAQRHRLTAYAEAFDLDLVDIVEDAGVSAKSLDRPGLKAALSRVQTGEADALLVAKLDRLTRSVKDLARLLEEHFGPDQAGLISVAESIDTTSAAGRLVLNVLVSVGQWEREAIGERTRDALRHLQKSGVRLGPTRSRLPLRDPDRRGRPKASGAGRSRSPDAGPHRPASG